MPDLITVLCNHVHYTQWATNRLLKAAEPLRRDELTRDFGTADKSILGTFVHLYRANRTWLQRVGPAAPGLAARVGPKVEEDDSEWPALIPRLQKLQEDWLQWCATLDNEVIEGSFRYSDTKGNPLESAYWETLLHVINHDTHHRAQISGFLRALGYTPPNIDFIAYQRGLGR